MSDDKMKRMSDYKLQKDTDGRRLIAMVLGTDVMLPVQFPVKRMKDGSGFKIVAEMPSPTKEGETEKWTVLAMESKNLPISKVIDHRQAVSGGIAGTVQIVLEHQEAFIKRVLSGEDTNPQEETE